MAKEVFSGPGATKGVPLSQAVKVGGFIFVSGHSGFQDPKTGETIKGLEAQTRRCFERIQQVLEAMGSTLADVVKVTVFLRNPTDFSRMNEVYKTYFPKEQPARTTVVTSLVRPDMLIEIECVAYHS